MQKWTYENGLLRNFEHDICLQSNEKQIVAAECNPVVENQIFVLHLLYTIDRYCSFKQGSYVFPSDGKWVISNNGYVLNNAHCLTYIESLSSYDKNICVNEDSQKWEFTLDGQLRNFILDVCVGLEENEIVVEKCESNATSQRWTCI